MLRSALATGLILLSNGVWAAEQLPVIVTYELQRGRDAEHNRRRDPKAFWIRQVAARLEDAKPSAPVGLARPATATVRFTVARDGRLTSHALAAASGIPAVDKQALAMLERAQPFPPMPAAMVENELTFTLPLRFR